MATNAFRATISVQTPIGICFEPDVISLANHSCTPNATVMFDGRRIELRALDAIEEGEQIFISYVDNLQSRDARRKELRERYFFECRCGKCERDEGPYDAFLRFQPVKDAKMELFVDLKELREFAKLAETSGLGRRRELEALVPTITDIIIRSGNATSPEQQLSILKSAFPLLKSKHYAHPPYPTLLFELGCAHLAAEHYPEAIILFLFMYVSPSLSPIHTCPENLPHQNST